jgi:subtilase family serine protease
MGFKKISGLFCVLSFALNAEKSLAQGAFVNSGELVLRLHERVTIEELANSVTDVRSTQYGRSYSADEIRDLSAPTDPDYHSLLQTLTSKGFEIVRESPTHLWITVKSPKSLNGKTSHWDQKLLSDLPRTFPLVESVIGLDQSRQAHVLHHFASSIQFGPLGPEWIRSSYGFDPIYQSGVNGKNQVIAIVSYGGFYTSDVDEYFSSRRISPAPKVDVIEVNGPVAITREAATEVGMDTEFAGMIAPGVHLLVFESSHNDDAGDVELFNAILDDGRAKVISYSWGNCETAVSHQHLLDMNKIFARAVAQGVNIIVGSGDFGAEGCPGDSGIVADWPASSPYVVAVGGTTIQGLDRGEVQETAWADSGGGMSGIFEKPSWQKDIPYERRAFPDVAFNADASSGEPAWVHSGHGGDEDAHWVTMGGTSIAAPQWAGFLALVGDARRGKPTLGFINPKIYNLKEDQRSSLFHDVTQGSNDGFFAGLGWDAVTGWGSMRASPLLEFLSHQ